MGYLQDWSKASINNLQREQFLVDQMWLVLIEANQVERTYKCTVATLGALKRFLYVIDGLISSSD